MEKVLNRVGKAMAWIGGQAVEETKEFERIVALKNTNVGSTAVAKLAQGRTKRTAAKFDKFTRAMTKLHREFSDLVRTFVPSMEYQFRKFQPQEKDMVLGSVGAMRANIIEAKTQVSLFAAALPRGISADLNASVGKTAAVLSEYVATIEVLETACTALINEATAASAVS